MLYFFYLVSFLSQRTLQNLVILNTAFCRISSGSSLFASRYPDNQLIKGCKFYYYVQDSCTDPEKSQSYRVPYQY